MHELDRDRVLRPRRARIAEAIAAVDGARSGEEAWERVEARGLIPSGTVGERGRAFGGWMISYDAKRTWSAVDRQPSGNVFAQRLASNEPSPPTAGLACALGSDWPGVLEAEAIAREVFHRLRPWMPAAGEVPAVQWRLGVGSNGRSDIERHCGELWFARARLIAYSGREVEEAGEIRAQLTARPATAVGEVCALEDAYLASLWRELAADLLRLRRDRDRARATQGLAVLGEGAPVDGEEYPWALSRMQVARFVVNRYWQRFGRAGGPSFLTAPNFFDSLVALWNTGYAPALFTVNAIVLEAPPIVP
ncbi:MAG: hypothetical protein U0269_11065 [Polyangiales bacterium]